MSGGGFRSGRRRLIRAHGRPMVLRRQVGMTKPIQYYVCDVQGVLRSYTPEQIVNGLQQGDCSIALLASDLAGWAGIAPRAQDTMLIDGAVWVIQGSIGVYDAAEVIGYTLHVRGGK